MAILPYKDNRPVVKPVDPNGTMIEYPNGTGGPTQFKPGSTEYYITGIDDRDPTLVQITSLDGSEVHYIRFNLYDDKSGIDGFVSTGESSSDIERMRKWYQKQERNTAHGYQEDSSGITYAVYDTDGDEILQPDEYLSSNATSNAMEPIVRSYGIPPQWTKFVDPRVCGFDCFDYNAHPSLGRRFLEVTVSNPTIVEIAPGFISYSEGFLNREGITEKLENFAGTGDASELKEILKDDNGTFFTIKPCFNNIRYHGRFPGYSSYVNALLAVTAVYMSRVSTLTGKSSTYFMHDGTQVELDQLGMRTVPAFGGIYKEFDWEHYDNPEGYFSFGGIFSLLKGYKTSGQNSGEDPFTYIRFFTSGNTKASDSFDTSLTDSQIGSAINSVTSSIKDITFILGGLIGDSLGSISTDTEDEIHAALEGINFKGTDGLKGLWNSITAISQGGRIVFPQIIDDCTYGKSINCECTFPAIYGDCEANFLNCMVPYIHLLCFVLPHQVRTSIEMYTYPFLVRAYAKGLFNCSMGLITGFTVERGGSDNELWSYDSSASEISVSFTITPMVSKLIMTSTQDGPGWLLKNDGLQEYLGTLCGIDLRNGKAAMAIDLLETLFHHTVVGWASNLLTPILQNEKIVQVSTFVNIAKNYLSSGDFNNMWNGVRDYLSGDSRDRTQDKNNSNWCFENTTL